jgi:hypothetical protein
MNTKYVLRHDDDGNCAVVKVTDHGETLLGTTALAILAEATQDDRLALALLQSFVKWEPIASAPSEAFELSEREILQWVEHEKAKLEPWQWHGQEQEYEKDHDHGITR